MSGTRIPPRGTPAWDAYRHAQDVLREDIRRAARESLDGPDPAAAGSRLVGLLYPVLEDAARRAARGTSSWGRRAGAAQCEDLAVHAVNAVLERLARAPEVLTSLVEADDPIAVAAAAARHATTDVFRALPDKEPHDGTAADSEDDADSAEMQVVARELRRIAEELLGSLPALDRVVYRLAAAPESDLPAAEAEWIARRRGIPVATLATRLAARHDRMTARDLELARSIENRGVRIGRLLENMRRVRAELARRDDGGTGEAAPDPERRAELRRPSGLRRATPDELRGFVTFLQHRVETLVATQAAENRTLAAVPGEAGAAQTDFHEIAEIVGELPPDADPKARKDAHNRVSHIYRKTLKRLREAARRRTEDPDD
jgi:hypothetical protein